MSLLPDDFQFNQGNLQDFVDCRRRFFHRHIQRLAWPAVEAEPIIENERRMQLGNIFHKLIQQHLVGISEQHLQVMVDHSEYASAGLSHWWQNYLRYAPVLSRENKHIEVEYTLAASVLGYRLVAKYDVLIWRAADDQSEISIVDWKTYAFRPSRKWLKERMQTRVYPFLVVQSGNQITNHPCLACDVEMLYWFPEHPDKPEHFHYSQSQYDDDAGMLQSLITEISSLTTEEQFPLTEIDGRCKFCTYRSLCERGTQAGRLSEREIGEDEEEIVIDFDQVAELEF